MSKQSQHKIHLLPAIVFLFITIPAFSYAQQVNLQSSFGMKITNVEFPEETPLRTDSAQLLFSAPPTDSEPAYPVPPLAGFSPLIVITTSDETGSGGESGWEQTLETSYSGNPLNGPADENYIIGIYDSGADIDLFAGSSAETLGFTGNNLTGNIFPIGGVGGSVDATLTQPSGIFAASLHAIDPNDGTIDLSQLLGHSNVAALAAPAIECNNGESITGVVGNPFIAFHTAVFRSDDYQKANYNGQFVSSPDVQIYVPDDAQIPTYPQKFAINFSSIATTANFYNLSDPFSTTPEFPTMLTWIDGFLPLGGSFLATIYAVEGEPGPTNPLQEMTVLVDTGAQSSIMSEAMVANLGLPIEPHFTVDVCGVGGLESGIPGYYVDYVKINAAGGALEFSHAPFVVLDLTLSDGTAIDGVLGMNFFWNRNIIFEPNPSGSGFVHVSAPVAYGNADFDFDGSVNLVDFALFASAWMSDAEGSSYLPVCDMYLDTKIDMKDLEAFMAHWLE